MASETWAMTIRANGNGGSATVMDFIHPQDDDRLMLDMYGSERIEHTGSRTTYMYQLEAFRAAVREGRPFATTTVDSVATMELIDACYRAAGLSPRNAGS
jgi:predicted dehydrogenase